MTLIEKQLKKDLPGVETNVVLKDYTSFKIGGPSTFFYVARDAGSVRVAVRVARTLEVPFFILGNGSNILIADQGFDGLVIKMENNSISFSGEIVEAESGVLLQKLVRSCVAKSLTGLEFLIGIPGTVGGGIAGNVGTPELWIDHTLLEVEVLDVKNKIVIIPRNQGDFSYRSSRFKYNHTQVILSARFQLAPSKQSSIQKKIRNFLERRSYQPVRQPSAGSIFKNPPDKPAWQLIDEVGMRGRKIGGAQVSQRHANFIINTGDATAEDVVVLISLIKQQVRDQLGVQLQEEIQYVGFDKSIAEETGMGYTR